MSWVYAIIQKLIHAAIHANSPGRLGVAIYSTLHAPERCFVDLQDSAAAGCAWPAAGSLQFGAKAHCCAAARFCSR